MEHGGSSGTGDDAPPFSPLLTRRLRSSVVVDAVPPVSDCVLARGVAVAGPTPGVWLLDAAASRGRWDNHHVAHALQLLPQGHQRKGPLRVTKEVVADVFFSTRGGDELVRVVHDGQARHDSVVCWRRVAVHAGALWWSGTTTKNAATVSTASRTRGRGQGALLPLPRPQRSKVERGGYRLRSYPPCTLLTLAKHEGRWTGTPRPLRSHQHRRQAATARTAAALRGRLEK